MSGAGDEQGGSLAADLHIQATYRLTEALVASEQRMKRRIELLAEVVFEADAAGLLVFLNQAWTRALGHPADGCLGRPLRDFVLSPDREALDRLQAGEPGEAGGVRPRLRFARASGGVAWMEISLSRLADGGAVGVLHDVTVVKQSEDELKKLSLVASSTDNLVIIADRDGRTEWVNEAFYRRTGYTLDDMRGRTPGSVLQGPGSDPRSIAILRQAIAEGRSQATELLNYTKAGTPYWVRVQLSPIRDETGAVQRFVSVQADVTEQRRVQGEIEAAKDRAEYLAAEAQAANQAKSEFLAVLSHEIRTPMNAVLGFAAVLQDTLLDEDQRDCVNTIARSGRSLLEIINEILDYSKIESGEFRLELQPADVRQCVSDAVELCRPPADRLLRLEVEINPAVPRTIVTDAGRLRQVLVNLVGNAVKFTASGRVRVLVGLAPPVGPAGRRVTFAVEDTGIGIAAKDLERIFAPFSQVDSSTTRKFGGTGLGLAIARRIVRSMGGEITVRSEPGQGSVFSFSLEAGAPVADGAARTVSRPPPARPLDPAAQALRILVVEDNDVNLKLTLRLLANLGLHADTAADGRQCLEACRERTYDLVFMDLRMPEMDGYEAAAELRRRAATDPRLAHLHICALTSNVMPAERDACFAAGMNGFLAKPVRAEELRTALERAAAALARGRAEV